LLICIPYSFYVSFYVSEAVLAICIDALRLAAQNLPWTDFAHNGGIASLVFLGWTSTDVCSKELKEITPTFR
jgi:hypothetical protein